VSGHGFSRALTLQIFPNTTVVDRFPGGSRGLQPPEKRANIAAFRPGPGRSGTNTTVVLIRILQVASICGELTSFGAQ
jgi:hypothetical protein